MASPSVSAGHPSGARNGRPWTPTVWLLVSGSKMVCPEMEPELSVLNVAIIDQSVVIAVGIRACQSRGNWEGDCPAASSRPSALRNASRRLSSNLPGRNRLRHFEPRMSRFRCCRWPRRRSQRELSFTVASCSPLMGALDAGHQGVPRRPAPEWPPAETALQVSSAPAGERGNQKACAGGDGNQTDRRQLHELLQLKIGRV